MKANRLKLIRWLLLSAVAVSVLGQSNQSSAREFSPTTLQISAPETVNYEFCGDLNLPITVSGTDATVIFSLFTKDYAESIKNIRNGYLGWHYVNHIDTCMYLSSPYKFSPGTNVIEWDGRTSTGTRVRRGEYRFYLWAYDHTGMGETVARYMDLTPSGVLCITHDNEGNPLINPVLFSGGNTYHTGNEPAYVTRSKWIVGNDPYDESLVETTGYSAWIDRGALAFDTDDREYFFTSMFVPKSGSYYGKSECQVMRKFRWVPNGEAELQLDWGDEGIILIDSWIPPEWYSTPGVVSNRDGFLFFVNMKEHDNDYKAGLFAADIQEGDLLFDVDLNQWWIDKEDLDGDGIVFAGPTSIISQNQYMVLGSHVSCLIQLINPYFFIDGNGDMDIRMYENGNGDYVGDRNFEEDADRPWLCHDSGDAQAAFNLSINRDHFVTFPSYGVGDVSFGLLAPDGTGIGYFALAGENRNISGMSIIDSMSPYDGMYFSTVNNSPDSSGIRYIASDCIKGIIVYMCDDFGYDPYYDPYKNHYRIEPWCTDNMAKLVFSPGSLSINNDLLREGDQIGVFTAAGMCVGAVKLREEAISTIEVNIWGDDTISPEIDGLLEDELILLRIWDYDTSTEYLVEAVTESGEFRYIKDAVIVVDSLVIHDVTDVQEKMQPREFSLSQNYPNPFNAVTSISFTLPHEYFVTLKIYSVLGEELTTLSSGIFSAGKHTVEWDASTYSNGIYLYRLEAGSFERTKKLMLLK